MSVREQLAAYVLGVLPADEVAAVEAAIAQDPQLARDAAALSVVVERLDDAGAVAPSAALKQRLLGTIAASTAPGRVSSIASRFAAIFDLTVERTAEMLGSLANPTSWMGAPGTIRMIHFKGGPAAAALDCGFVEVSPGMTFPLHRHEGEELTLVISGEGRDSLGNELRPGTEITMPHDSQHAVTATSQEPLVYAVRFGKVLPPKL